MKTLYENTILIVDDSPEIIDIIVDILEDFNTKISISGEDALEIIFKDEPPDLILLDVIMPKMNGFEVCKEIRKDFDPTELPIIFLSAKNQINDFVSGLEIGGNDYLMKPFSKNELLARIKSHWSMAKIHSSNNRFVPKEFLGLLGHENILDINLGDHTEMMMTVLFSDIRSFTSISEKMSPEQNFNFVNDYFSYMGSVIRDNTGFIDKYIGDAIMALFPDSPNHSVNAAIKMQQAVTQFNSDFKNIYDEVSIGIGMHHGNVMLGTVGDSDRMEGTVISDSVNLSSRIEGLCKTYGAGILMTSGVLKKISQAEQYQIRYLGKIQVKGKNTTTLLYEIMDGLADAELKHKLASQKTFELGLDYYYQLDFESARKHFATALEIFAEDKAAILYHSRCQQHIDHPTEYSENFVDAMTTK